MARHKKLATILKDVDYKKPYKPNKPNTELYYNILNYAIFNGRLDPIDRFSIRRIRDALAYYEYDSETGETTMTFKPKFKNLKQILDILGHEMVHHWQLTIGKDTGNHNAIFYKWKTKFNRMGLDLKVRY